MGVKVKHWKGAYWVFINHRGRRKAKRVGEGDKAKRAAQRAAEIIQGKLASGDVSALEESRGRIRTLKDFAEEWLSAAVLLHCKPATQENYRVALRRHWLPALGALPLSSVTRERIRTVMAEKLSKAELKPSSLRSALIPLSACLHAALEAGLIPGNPAIRLGRFLRRPDDAEVPTIDPFTPAELTTILTTAEQQMPESYPLILTLARTGVRIGEALALKREDLDFHQGTLWVRRTWGRRTIGTTKTGKARRVDMSQQLRRVLEAHLTLREAEAVVAGRADSPWLVPDPERPEGSLPLTPLAFYKAVWWTLLRRAGVRYRKPHTLRHTFASLLLQNGESVTYVRDQLGHSSIRMTVDTYGHLVPGANRGAVDRLDDATGRNLYATNRSGEEASSEEPRGVRRRPEYFRTKWAARSGRSLLRSRSGGTPSGTTWRR
ncbi:MAG TPA: site-specific integrase [Candidatus Limnocylindria bacterium]|nr:site-specific integrase [Candidatus Limnocylindria bacterium]